MYRIECTLQGRNLRGAKGAGFPLLIKFSNNFKFTFYIRAILAQWSGPQTKNSWLRDLYIVNLALKFYSFYLTKIDKDCQKLYGLLNIYNIQLYN